MADGFDSGQEADWLSSARMSPNCPQPLTLIVIAEMNNAKLSKVLEAADKLTLDEQEALVEIVRRRIAQQRRVQLAREIRSARREFQSGRPRAVSLDELMREILS